MSGVEEVDLEETVRNLLQDMEIQKKRIKHLEEQIIKLRSGKKWV